jgi:predicted GNAT family N-acyltransferase
MKDTTNIIQEARNRAIEIAEETQTCIENMQYVALLNTDNGYIVTKVRTGQTPLVDDYIAFGSEPKSENQIQDIIQHEKMERQLNNL